MVVVEYMKFVGVREGDAEHRIRWLAPEVKKPKQENEMVQNVWQKKKKL